MYSALSYESILNIVRTIFVAIFSFLGLVWRLSVKSCNFTLFDTLFSYFDIVQLLCYNVLLKALYK